MKKFCLIVWFVLIVTNLKAQSGSGWEWISTSGATASSPGIEVKDIASDANGNVYSVGRYYNTSLTIGTANLPTAVGSDIFIAKYNASGTLLWLKRHAPSTGHNELGQVIATDASGNVYIGGTDDTPNLSGVSFLAKYDTDGNMIWNEYFSLHEVGGINIAPDGNLIIMESNQTTKNILKINKTDGSTLWTVPNTGAGSNAGTVYKDFVDQNGNIYYTCFASAANTVNIAGESITTTGLASFIASIDNDGQKRWVQTIDNIQIQLGYTTDESGRSYLIFTGGGGGTFQGINTVTNTNRYFELDNTGAVIKYSLTSPYIASKKMFRVKGDNVYGFYIDQAGNAHGVTIGDYMFNLPATPTFALGLLAKYDRTNGQVIWVNSFEVNGSNYNSGSFTAIETAVNNKVIVGGAYGTSVKFGNNSATATGALYATDFYLAQFNADNVAAPAVTNWNGNANDGNWSNAANWDNGVPDGNKKTNIPSGISNYPISIPSNATGGKIEIAVGATIRLPLSFSAPAGIINNGTIEISETTSGTFMGTFANNVKPTGNGKIVFKNDKTTIYLIQALDQSIEINSSAAITSYGGTLNGNLILTNGILNIASSNLILNGNIMGGSATSYVAGPLSRRISANGNYNFPVGTADRYAPVSLQLKNITGPQNISVTFSKTIGGSAPNIVVGGQTVTSLLNSGIWTISPDIALTGGSYTVTLNGTGFTNQVSDATKYVVLKRTNSASSWGFYGDNGLASQNANMITAMAGNISGFSDFAIGIASGSVVATLPVKLTSFTAKNEVNSVFLTWETSSELNNEKFAVERSEGGIDFIAIGEVKGHSTVQTSSLYNFRDNQPLNGYNYYRLKQIDLNGNFEYSDVRVVKFGISTNEANVKIYPNPVVKILNIDSNIPVSSVSLYDLYGKKVLGINTSVNKIALPNHLANGVYMLNINFRNGTSAKQKIIVTR